MFFSAPPSSMGFGFTPPQAMAQPQGLSPWALQGLMGGNDMAEPGMRVRGGFGLNLEQPRPSRGARRLSSAQYNPVTDGLMQASPGRTFRS